MALFEFPAAKQDKAPPSVQTATVFDVTSKEFQVRVLDASMEKPVLVDFWAPWCGPCKQLMPGLESEVNAANGEVILAKVNIDDNQDLAQALQIQSVPTVMAFFQGQPVTGFAGARPQSEIKNLIAQLIKLSRSAKPDAIDIPTAIKQASDFMIAKDFMNAQELYLRILTQDENNAEAYAGLIRILIENGAIEKAETMMMQAPEALQKNPAIISIKTALELAKTASALTSQLQPLLKKVEKDPSDHQVRFDLAQAQFAGGDRAGAIDNLLHIARADRTWNDDAARKELLRFFEALGFADPLSVEGRKKLSRILFS